MGVLQQISCKIQSAEDIFLVNVFADLIQAYGNGLLGVKRVLSEGAF